MAASRALLTNHTDSATGQILVSPKQTLQQYLSSYLTYADHTPGKAISCNVAATPKLSRLGVESTQVAGLDSTSESRGFSS
jgi:hypothetical protein